MNKQELKELIEVRNNELQDVNYWASDYHKGHDRATRFFLHLLDQLDEPEITEKQAWEVISGNPEIKEFGEALSDQMKYRALERRIKLLTNLDIADFIEELTKNGLNKNKLVEVPQFVADWYEKNKDDLEDNIDALIRNSRDGVIRRPIETWMLDKSNRPIETLIRMKEGYTIEPPKTLQVIVKKYDSTVFKTDIPEDEAMKLIEGWKDDAE